jgi:mannose-6-phosphate isomerase-like protein (cupin superfamily)
MELKPSDFFIGVIDFFSVILPGALVTYFLKGLLHARVFGVGKVFPEPETEAQKWIVFLLTTYIIGNLIFLVGSLLIDKLVYDQLLRNRFFKKNFDLSYHAATLVRDEYISSETLIRRMIEAKRLKEEEIRELLSKEKREIINTFKWAQHYLAVKFPETLLDIKRFEADSKFFRSLVIAFLFISAAQLVKAEFISSAIFFLLAVASIYRYGDFRYKSTERAYEVILTLDHLTKITGDEAGHRSQDNRDKFLASPEVIAPHQERIAALTEGLNLASELLAIPANETWQVQNSTAPQTLFCLRGTGTTKNRTGNGREQAIVFSPNATFPIPPDSSFEITNRQQEPLLLLSLKEK